MGPLAIISLITAIVPLITMIEGLLSGGGRGIEKKKLAKKIIKKAGVIAIGSGAKKEEVDAAATLADVFSEIVRNVSENDTLKYKALTK